MRAYIASDLEALRARNLLKDWRGEGLLTAEQYQRMEQETVCELRRTNMFLRLVLFLFTLFIVAAATGLFFTTFLRSPGNQALSIFLLIFAGCCYAAAEIAVSEARLYRYGVEEALAVCSLCFLCAGIQVAVSGDIFSSSTGGALFLYPVAGLLASLWISYRFAFPYAPLGAMIFGSLLPGYWTASPSAQHLIVVVFYSAGLTMVAAIRPRYRFTYLNSEYSIAEAILWLGIYLAVNLQLSAGSLPGNWSITSSTISRFSEAFYWATWVLIWCLPPVVLARGLRQKDRLVIAAGGIAAILTLVTNKLYLGWQRHTWDPMLLGALLIGIALLIRHWLASGQGGIRYGFTAQRLSGKDKRWMNAAVGTIGLGSPAIVTSGLQGDSSVHFGGGDSGGGGASSDF